MSLHHLINALCSLSLEAMEMAYGNNKVDTLCILTHVIMWLRLKYTVRITFLFLYRFSGAISVCRRQAAGDWPRQHGSYRDPVETANRTLVGGNIYLELHKTHEAQIKNATYYSNSDKKRWKIERCFCDRILSNKVIQRCPCDHFTIYFTDFISDGTACV